MIGFSDASLEAYACMVYLKFIKQSGDSKIAFVTSKSRVAPMKDELSICRLELLGALILSRLIKNILEAFKNYYEIRDIFCFTDSMVTLGWIKATNKEFKTFVQNRVIEIRHNVDVDSWF